MRPISELSFYICATMVIIEIPDCQPYAGWLGGSKLVAGRGLFCRGPRAGPPYAVRPRTLRYTPPKERIELAAIGVIPTPEQIILFDIFQ